VAVGGRGRGGLFCCEMCLFVYFIHLGGPSVWTMILSLFSQDIGVVFP